MIVNRFFLRKSLRIIFLFVVMFAHINQAVLPQPGENIRDVCVLIATEVDTLLTCCATTFTAIAELGACGAIPLSQKDVIDGGILLSTTGFSYCLSQNITGSIIVTAPGVTIDLNSYSLLGTIDVLNTATNVTIENGKVMPLAAVSNDDAAHAAIVIASGANNALIQNCYIVCSDNILASAVGRDGINNSADNVIIDSCVVQASHGGQGVPFAYVTNSGSNTVSPINLSNNFADTAINVGTLPNGIAVTPDGKNIWVTNQLANSVSVIDALTDSVVATISGFGTPVNIAITPDGTTAYVVCSGIQSVVPVDTSTYALGVAISVGNAPQGIAIAPNGTVMYITNVGDGTVTPIAIPSNIAAAPIGVGNDPVAIAITPDSSTAYVVNNTDLNITPIDIASGIPAPAFFIGSGMQGIAITPDGTTIYVTAGGPNVIPIAIPAQIVGSPISGFTNPQGIAITPDGTTAYVVNYSSSNVIPIDIASNIPGIPILVGSFPLGIAIGSLRLGTNGGSAIIQNGNNGNIVHNTLTGGAGRVGGSGLLVTDSSSVNIIKECLSTNGGGAGFTLLTSGTANLIECVASSNAGQGFDLSNSTGKGLVEACRALQNVGCGFNDKLSSVYSYMACVAKGNGATPADSITDSNYCLLGVGTAVADGISPFFQFAPNNIAAASPNLSSWNNITLP